MTDRQTPHGDAVDDLLAHVDEDLDNALDNALHPEDGLAAVIDTAAEFRHRVLEARLAAARRGAFIGFKVHARLRYEAMNSGRLGPTPAMAGAGTSRSDDAEYNRMPTLDHDLFGEEVVKRAPPIIGL